VKLASRFRPGIVEIELVVPGGKDRGHETPVASSILFCAEEVRHQTSESHAAHLWEGAPRTTTSLP
jgi:hypothetical protein